MYASTMNGATAATRTAAWLRNLSDRGNRHGVPADAAPRLKRAAVSASALGTVAALWCGALPLFPFLRLWLTFLAAPCVLAVAFSLGTWSHSAGMEDRPGELLPLR